MFKKFVFLTLSVLWMVLIYSFSAETAESSAKDSMFITDYIIKFFFSNPSEEIIGLIETIIRKLAHFTEYAILSMLLTQTFRSFGCDCKTSMFAVLVTSLYAISDEIHQYFVPGRACRLFDIFIDTCGAFAGYYACYIFHLIFRQKRTRNE